MYLHKTGHILSKEVMKMLYELIQLCKNLLIITKMMSHTTQVLSIVEFNQNVYGHQQYTHTLQLAFWPTICGQFQCFARRLDPKLFCVRLNSYLSPIFPCLTSPNRVPNLGSDIVNIHLIDFLIICKK